MRTVEAEYVLEQYLCADELADSPIRSLKFEVYGTAYDSSDCEISAATLLSLTETHSGQVLDSRKFGRDNPLSRQYGAWFVQELESNESLREKIEAALLDDYAWQIEDGQMRSGQ